MLERLRYPVTLNDRVYDRDFAIRGLVFDNQRGVLLKLSYARAISPDTAFLGRRRLSEEELRGMYGEALQACRPIEMRSSHRCSHRAQPVHAAVEIFSRPLRI